ncbi:MAG: adenylate/guanylate cyclase domain-containing protein [Thermoleophilia bacterium]|nr:adenylate/guanylate cyclase domain-containing protein [Thermoleophilia bacterium]
MPRTRYATSGGIKIAYQVHGAGEHDLIFSGGSTSNIETVWNLPEAVRFFERLCRFSRVIFFDRRDTGVSDPLKDDLTLESHVADALAVMDAVGVERPVLFGASDCARAFATLAAVHPERVGGLIALAASPGLAGDAPPEIAEKIARAISDPDYPEGVVDIFAPEWAGDPERRDRLIRYLRTSATPRQAERVFRMSTSSDVSDVLPLVQAPTLVIGPRDIQMPPAEAVREFAELVPGAEFRGIPGAAGMLYALDVDQLADLIEEFVTGRAPAPVTNRVLASVLFTDLVGSTERASELGDSAWSALLDRHHGSTRAAVERHGGETVKTLGDGVLATFAGPAQAVRCAEQVIAEAGSQGLEVRSGIHTGEVEVGLDDISGLAVHLAARIMALAGAGEILVSRTVRDLVVGSQLTFTDRGEHELKGIEEPWHVYAME